MADEALRAREAKLRAQEGWRFIQTLTVQQSGVTPKHAIILEGVYELEKRPSPATIVRLATQFSLDVAAVQAWFRSRRVHEKRVRQRRVILVVLVLALLAAIGYGVYADLQRKAKEKIAKRARGIVFEK